MNLDRETLKKLIKESINELAGPEKSAEDAAKDLQGLSGSGKAAAEGLAKLKSKLKAAFTGVQNLTVPQKAILANFFVSELLFDPKDSKVDPVKVITSFMRSQSDKDQKKKKADAAAANQAGEQGLE